MTHTAQKIKAGHYVYRGHHVVFNEDAPGPDGGRSYWSISDPKDPHSAHPMNPFLDSLKACKLWLDAEQEGDVKRRNQIEQDHWGT